MRKKILGASFVVAMAAIAGYNTYVDQTKSEMSDLTLANVEALAKYNPETGLTECEDDNFVPNHYLTTKTEAPVTVTSDKNGQIEVNNIVKGGFESNKTVIVVPVTYNCDGEETGACCDQRLVRADLLKVKV